MLAYERLTIYYECDRVLQIGADRQNRLIGREGADRPRGIASATAKDCGTEWANTYDGVIHASGDWPFANQECVGDVCQAFERIVIFVGDRFA